MAKPKKEKNLKLIDGKWYIDFTFNKKRIRAFGGYTKEQARNTLTKLKMQCLNKKMGFEMEKKPDILFKDFANEFMESYAKINKRSWKRDQTSLNNLIPFFKSMFLSNITAAAIEKYKAKRLKDGVAVATINRELTCLKTIYNKANEWERVNCNPAANIKNFKENNKIQIILNPNEIKRLITSATDHLKPIIIIAVNTGMRRGEILNLKWKNINFIKGYIEIEDSKSGESRKVPMNSTVSGKLQMLDKDNKFIFYNPKTKKNIVEIKRSFNTARKKAGLKKIRFHDLRHTAATRMCEIGVPLKIVSKILGHSTIKMTERYANPTPDSMKEAVERLSKYIETRQKVDTPPKTVTIRKPVSYSYLYN